MNISTSPFVTQYFAEAYAMPLGAPSFNQKYLPCSFSPSCVAHHYLLKLGSSCLRELVRATEKAD